MFIFTCLYVSMLTCIRLHMFTCLLKFICSHGYCHHMFPSSLPNRKGGVGGIHGIMFTHPHILTPTCTRTHICTCHLPTYVQYICSHIHVYISTYVFTCSLVIQTRVHLITAHLFLYPVFILSVVYATIHMFMCSHIHMSVCTYVHIYVCSHVHNYTYAHMFTCTYVSLFTYSYVHAPICTYVCMYTCPYTHMLT